MWQQQPSAFTWCVTITTRQFQSILAHICSLAAQNFRHSLCTSEYDHVRAPVGRANMARLPKATCLLKQFHAKTDECAAASTAHVLRYSHFSILVAFKWNHPPSCAHGGHSTNNSGGLSFRYCLSLDRLLAMLRSSPNVRSTDMAVNPLFAASSAKRGGENTSTTNLDWLGLSSSPTCKRAQPLIWECTWRIWCAERKNPIRRIYRQLRTQQVSLAINLGSTWCHSVVTWLTWGGSNWDNSTWFLPGRSVTSLKHFYPISYHTLASKGYPRTIFGNIGNSLTTPVLLMPDLIAGLWHTCHL